MKYAQIFALGTILALAATAAFAQNVVGFDITMQQARRVHRSECAAQGDAENDGFIRPHGALLDDLRGQGVAIDPIAPQPGSTVMACGTVDAEHVVMANAGQAPGFVEEAARC